jgi:hypothetical protein
MISVAPVRFLPLPAKRWHQKDPTKKTPAKRWHQKDPDKIIILWMLGHALII